MPSKCRYSLPERHLRPQSGTPLLAHPVCALDRLWTQPTAAPLLPCAHACRMRALRTASCAHAPPSHSTTPAQAHVFRVQVLHCRQRRYRRTAPANPFSLTLHPARTSKSSPLHAIIGSGYPSKGYTCRHQSLRLCCYGRQQACRAPPPAVLHPWAARHQVITRTHSLGHHHKYLFCQRNHRLKRTALPQTQASTLQPRCSVSHFVRFKVHTALVYIVQVQPVTSPPRASLACSEQLWSAW